MHARRQWCVVSFSARSKRFQFPTNLKETSETFYQLKLVISFALFGGMTMPSMDSVWGLRWRSSAWFIVTTMVVALFTGIASLH
jgi:hypothetical protein